MVTIKTISINEFKKNRLITVTLCFKNQKIVIQHFYFNLNKRFFKAMLKFIYSFQKMYLLSVVYIFLYILLILFNFEYVHSSIFLIILL